MNDRGPMASNLIVDLSFAAATRLGFDVNGLAKVRIEVVNPTDPKLAEDLVSQLRMDDPAVLESSEQAVMPVMLGFAQR